MKMLALAIVLLSFPWLSHAQSNRYSHRHDGYKNNYFWQDVENREYKQQRKIDRGIETGVLTHREVRQLEREHRHVDEQIRHFKRYRHLSHMNKKSVMKHLDHYGEQITHLKHNNHYVRRHNHQQYSHYNKGSYYRNKQHISSARNKYSIGFHYKF